MRLVMFSMTPLFADRSMGGAQKQLRKVALHLAQQGHQVRILCTRRQPDAMLPFDWHANARVLPVLRFRQPFPEPYATPVYNIANAISDVLDEIQQADAFYSHDGGLIFPYVYEHRPAIVSLRSVLFSETLQSGFLFNGDALIVPSPHAARVWQHTAGRFYPELRQRTHIIPNGLDFDVYHPGVDAAPLAQRLGLEPGRYRYLLYPHRPDDGKGIRQTIALMRVLVGDYGVRDVRVLVPRWIDIGLAPHVRAYYDSLLAEIARLGLTEYFVFHDWISDDDMPAFYRLGAAALVLGNYVETFGNTPYEALACGTPAVVASVAAYRDMLPAEMLVDYGDTAAAARKVYECLQGQAVSRQTYDWLRAGFDQRVMVDAYAQIILGQPKLAPMRHVYRQPVGYTFAPWVAFTRDGRLYHDFLGDYVSHPVWADGGVQQAYAEDAVREGIMVPVYDDDPR
jgi:glycosyltransferase involved in cell wall biosynthesis